MAEVYYKHPEQGWIFGDRDRESYQEELDELLERIRNGQAAT